MAAPNCTACAVGAPARTRVDRAITSDGEVASITELSGLARDV